MKSLNEEKVAGTPFEILLSRDRISRRICELGAEITRDYAGKEPVLVGVLKGGAVFLADLMRAINLPLEIDFVSAASYRQGTAPSKNVVLGGRSTISLKGRHVLIVDGIVDTGRTITAIVDQIRHQEPASTEVVTLVDKPASHRVRVNIRYKGFSVGNDFVIGFGLDNAQKYRNLPYIGRVVEQ